MAAAKTRSQLAIGSAQWIAEQREHAAQLVDQEVEEFSFAARNELEWLNAHMVEIFSQQQMNLTDVFKTPGKLRGKTPRTARKKDSKRAPLTDLFAPNPQSTLSPAQRTPFFQKVSKIAVAREEDEQPEKQPTIRRSPPRTGKANTDSGYHGMAEDDTDNDAYRATQGHASGTSVPALQPKSSLLPTDVLSTEESFVSAQEGPTQNAILLANATEGDQDENATIPDETIHATREQMNAHVDGQHDDMQISIHEDDPVPETDTMRAEDATDSSSLDQALVRKSSLNFASLPPREALSGKRSIGPRNSQLQHDAQVTSQTLASGVDEVMIDAEESSSPAKDPADHNKTSTQRLHERITRLGQARDPQMFKNQAVYPTLPNLHNKSSVRADDLDDDLDDDDDWIAPIRSSAGDEQNADDPMSALPIKEPTAKATHWQQKSISTNDILSTTADDAASEALRAKASSASVPNLSVSQKHTSTPTASPRKANEGPLSASKSRLHSVFKSAKSILFSSADVSAQAKMDVSMSLSSATKENVTASDSLRSRMPGGFEDDTVSVMPPSGAKAGASRPLTAFLSSSKNSLRSRTPADGVKKTTKQTKMDVTSADNLEKARAKEATKAADQKHQRDIAEEERVAKLELEAARAAQETAQAEQQQLADQESQAPRDMAPPAKPRAGTRLVKPARKVPGQGSKPMPVNIRVPSQAQRVGSAQPSAASNSLLEPTPPPSSRPASAASRPAVTRAGSANPTNAKVKALEAAARKKEQDERIAAEKAEKKKELERKRAAKLEEERRAEQERTQEAQRRAQEVRAVQAKQAEERRMEQQKREARIKAEAEAAEALEKERARSVQASQQRSDVPNTMRHLAKQTVDMPNKGSKRQLGKEAEDTRTSAQTRTHPSYQQQDAKRRRTNDDDDMDSYERHSVMAPPKRPSNMRKDMNKFPHGYVHAPPPAPHHASNVYKPASSQSLKPGMQPAETIKFSNARIPFAENANPPASAQDSQPPQHHGFKTPARPMPAPSQHPKTRSSPAYPPGDNIALPEIHTDSEDDSGSDHSDDEGDAASPGTTSNGAAASSKAKPSSSSSSFRAPSWVASPALRELLTQQQLVDPETVFGPIGALNMDEVFRTGGGKNAERAARRFRERGESAMWVESGDQVTSAEKRRDREARERVVREGGWRYGGDL